MIKVKKHILIQFIFYLLFFISCRNKSEKYDRYCYTSHYFHLDSAKDPINLYIIAFRDSNELKLKYFEYSQVTLKIVSSHFENLIIKKDTIFIKDILIDKTKDNKETLTVQPYYVLAYDSVDVQELKYRISNSPSNRNIKFIRYDIEKDQFTYDFRAPYALEFERPGEIITINRNGIPYEINHYFGNDLVLQHRLKNKCNETEDSIINSISSDL